MDNTNDSKAMPTRDEAITFRNVSFAYNGKNVFSDLSLNVKKGECICLFGPSGCGKSTMLRIITGLEKHLSAGEVKINADRISMVFQEDRLLPFLTVRENAEMFADRDANEMIARLGLSDAADEYPSQLSGGMSRRAAIARALSRSADIYVFDEPFNGLDEENKKATASLIVEKTAGGTVLAVLHDREDAELLGCRIFEVEPFCVR